MSRDKNWEDEGESKEKFFHKNPVKHTKFLKQIFAAEEAESEIQEYFSPGRDFLEDNSGEIS